MIRDPTFSSSSATYKAIIKRELKVWNEGPMNNLPMNEHTFMAWKVIHTATLREIQFCHSGIEEYFLE